MTINKAMAELVNSEGFKLAARKDSRLRTYLVRYNRGELKTGATVELLLEFGYTITATKPKKSIKGIK